MGTCIPWRSGGNAKHQGQEVTLHLTLLVAELHLRSRQIDNIMFLENMRMRPSRPAIDQRKILSFHMGEEIPITASGNHRHLHARFAQRSERTVQHQFVAGTRP